MSTTFDTSKALFFPVPSEASVTNGSNLAKTICKENGQLNIFSSEIIFNYTNNNNQFNLTSSSPLYYMTLFHVGVDAGSKGYELCLVRRTTDSAKIQIGIRYYSGSGPWTEVSGSFFDLESNITSI